MIRSAAKTWGRAAIDALFPLKCAACGAIFGPGDGGPPATFLCAECARDYWPVQSPKCTQCGMPFISPHGPDHLCGGCREKSNRFTRARAAGVYEGPLRTAIHRFKYQQKTALARPLSRLLAQAFLLHFKPGDIDVVVPTPLHVKRLRERGFNQAAVLVKYWGRRQDSLPRADTRVLVRRRATRSQAGLGARERAANIKGAFAAVMPETVRGKNALLIDDVFTTGATANECARVLLKAGAARVDVLTLAVVVR